MKHVYEYLDEMIDEFFEERAAIMTYCGERPIREAEAAARIEAEEYAARRKVASADAGVNK